MSNIKISVVTVVFNARHTIADTILSVAAQRYANVEHIVVDGASNDGTLDIINQHRDKLSQFVSEPDTGIYDAMNKGIALATGDVIGMLNADDVFQDESVLDQVARAHSDVELDAVYADLVYVSKNDLSNVVRYWRSKQHNQGLCFKGWMPAHPTLYLKKSVYQKVGLYNTELRYQADLEFCARAFELHHINSRYINELWVRMRLGGVTNNSAATMFKGNWESYLALKKLGLKRNPISFFLFKFIPKLTQFWPFQSNRQS